MIQYQIKLILILLCMYNFFKERRQKIIYSHILNNSIFYGGKLESFRR